MAVSQTAKVVQFLTAIDTVFFPVTFSFLKKSPVFCCISENEFSKKVRIQGWCGGVQNRNPVQAWLAGGCAGRIAEKVCRRLGVGPAAEGL